eukprot:g829.t1
MPATNYRGGVSELAGNVSAPSPPATKYAQTAEAAAKPPVSRNGLESKLESQDGDALGVAGVDVLDLRYDPQRALVTPQREAEKRADRLLALTALGPNTDDGRVATALLQGAKAAEEILFSAVEEGNMTGVRAVLDQAPSAVHARSGFTRSTPLHYAARSGLKEVVELLLERGANTQARDSDGKCPLHHAAEYGHQEVAALLVGKGRASPKLKAKDGRSPLDCTWEQSPSSPTTLTLLRARNAGIGSVIKRHLKANLGLQLGKLVDALDIYDEHSRVWVGTNTKDQFGKGKDGLWAKGGDEAVSLLLRVLREAPSALVVPLFEKLFVPAPEHMMANISSATVDSHTKMLTYAAATWPSTRSYMSVLKLARPEHGTYRRLRMSPPDDDRGAVPVEAFVFALKGFISDNRLLQALAFEYTGNPSLFETDAVVCLEQHLWQEWGATEFLLRLLEFMGYVAATVAFCWLNEPLVQGCISGTDVTWPCKGTSLSVEGDIWTAKTGSSLVLGAVVVAWSARYLIEQLVEYHTTTTSRNEPASNSAQDSPVKQKVRAATANEHKGEFDDGDIDDDDDDDDDLVGLLGRSQAGKKPKGE